MAPQKPTKSGISGAKWLRVQTCPASQQTGGEHTAVVYNQQIVGAEACGKLGKLPVLVLASRLLQMEHPGGAPIGQRLLGNQLFRKIKIELGNLHFLDYIGTNFPLRFRHKLLYSHYRTSARDERK